VGFELLPLSTGPVELVHILPEHGTGTFTIAVHGYAKDRLSPYTLTIESGM